MIIDFSKPFPMATHTSLPALQKANRPPLGPRIDGSQWIHRGKWPVRGRNWDSSPGQSFDVPLADDEFMPALHSRRMQYKGAPGQGITYAHGHRVFMPDTVKPPGVYKDKDTGREWFVKTGMNTQPSGLMIGPGIPSEDNHAIRSEYTAHKLYEALASPESKIRGLRVHLHSDALGGAPVPDGYTIAPGEGIYMVMPRLTKADSLRNKTMSALPMSRLNEIWKNVGRGAAVDALLGGNDLHANNLWIHDDNTASRLDTGAMLGYSAAGTRSPNARGNFWDTTLLDAYRDRSLRSVPGELRKPAFLANLPIIHMYTQAFRSVPPQEMLEHIRQVAEKFFMSEPQIRKAIQHHHDPDGLYEQLSARAIQMMRTYALYKDDPEQLQKDVELLSQPAQDPLHAAARQRIQRSGTAALNRRRGAPAPVPVAQTPPQGQTANMPATTPARTERVAEARAKRQRAIDRAGMGVGASAPIGMGELGNVDGENFAQIMPQAGVPVPMERAAQHMNPRDILETDPGLLFTGGYHNNRLNRGTTPIVRRIRKEAIRLNRAAIRRWLRALGVRDAARRGDISLQDITPDLFGPGAIAPGPRGRLMGPFAGLNPEQDDLANLKRWRSGGPQDEPLDAYLQTLQQRKRFRQGGQS